jgi:uncharacterized protein YciI
MAPRMFAVVLEHGAAWDDARGLREQDGWDAHAAFMDALVDDGFVVLGGPFADGTRVLHAVAAEDEDAVRARLEADPWHGDGHLRIVSVDPWTVLLDGRTVRR